ncbi:MAG TPA: PQQ-binding-like beta-propeller repeat protein [Gemmatimonadaceae bacterium]
MQLAPCVRQLQIVSWRCSDTPGVRHSSMHFRVRGALAACAFAACSSCEPVAPGPRLLWHVHGHAGSGRPALDSTTAYFVAQSDSHVVHAFDLATGKPRWSAPTGAAGSYSLAGCLVAQQNVLCGDVSDLVAFARSDGHLVWRYRPSIGPNPGVIPGCLDSAQATLYAPTQTGAVHAIDASTGQSRWTAQLSTANTALYRVSDGGDVVFAAFTDFSAAPNRGGVVALNTTDGSTRWLTTLPSPVDSNSGAKDVVTWGALVIASLEDGRVVALNRATGAVSWTLPGVGQYPAWQAPGGPVGLDYRALMVSENYLFAASASGWIVVYDLGSHTEVWRGATNHASIAGWGASRGLDRAYMTSTSGYVFTVPLNPPFSMSQFAAPGFGTTFLGAATAANDRVLLGADDGYYAFRR